MMKLASLALLFSLAFVGSSAQAQTLNTGVNVNGSASTRNSDTSVKTDADSSVDANTNEDDSTAADDSSSAGVDSSASGTMNSGLGVGFSILRSEMDSSADYAITKADSVRTSASLESYAAATIRADERLDSVEMKEGKMDMQYRKPAKFLWIFPASINAHVTVDQEGTVTATYPWYAFLFSTDESRSELEAEIRSEIESIDETARVAASAEVAGDASVSVQDDSMIRRWARIIEAVYIAVSGDARVDASAQASS